jgi:chromosome segregation ATPase
MKRPLTLAAIAVLCAGLLTSGWSRKPNKEELAKLQEQNQSADIAEKKLAELRAEKTQLESELDTKKQELKKSEDDLAAVKAKVGQK